MQLEKAQHSMEVLDQVIEEMKRTANLIRFGGT